MKTRIKFLVVIVLLCAAGCGREAIDEHKVIGAWRIDIPRKKSLVYDFREDHTYTMGTPDKAGVPWGYWRLEGNRLTQDSRLLAANLHTNANTKTELVGERDMVANMTTTVTITSISDTEMTWRGDASFAGLTLKKVSQ